MPTFIEPHTLRAINNDERSDANEEMITSTLSSSPIHTFYKKTNIFITGGTGFLGKVLTEKLLRCFPEIDTIYLLMRAKRGKDIESRMDVLYDDALFLKLHKALPKFRHKIRAMTGDCALPNLGLSIADRQELVDKVDVVFHVAATVRFDEKLRLAVAINVNGTRDILELAKEMKNLKAIVHVSTAYCNCHLQDIDEKFYPPPMEYQKMNNMVDSLSDKILDQITPFVLEDWPNTYALTKAVAENIIYQEGVGLPIVVFRPAVVVGIYNDPMPGWIDNLYGPTSVLFGAATGVLKTIYGDVNQLANVVPVDMCVNAMIASAWDVDNSPKATEPDQIPIYNYVSSCEQPLKWKDFLDLSYRYGTEIPTTRALWYYSFTVNKQFWLHWIYTWVLHYIPAMLIDGIRFMQGKEPRLVKIYKKIDKFSRTMAYFSLRTWDFTNPNVGKLWKRVDPADQNEFMFDINQLNWHDFFYNYIRGCRVFLAKDDLSTVPQAIIRWNRLYWLHQAVKTVCALVLLRIAWFLLSCVFSFFA